MVVLGGGVLLYRTFADPNASSLVVMVGGFIGATLQFVYGQEVQTRTARQTSTAQLVGATNGVPSSVTADVHVEHDAERPAP